MRLLFLCAAALLPSGAALVHTVLPQWRSHVQPQRPARYNSCRRLLPVTLSAPPPPGRRPQYTSGGQPRIAPVYPLLAAKLQKRKRFATRTQQAISTLLRVALPTVIATVIGFVYFDNLSLYIRSTLDIGTIRILQADDAQFIQNFLTVIGLLFSILAGNAYSALYQQQESIYFALFQEVSEAKSLLEQTTLVCQGRPFYQSALQCIRDYVKNDLRRLDIAPAELLSTRPMEDPLESIMYMTSVGVPSIVYETVKNLRQARGERLGAMQRKFPFLGIGLLYLLAMVELLAFPLLGAGTATITGVLSLQSFLFACLCGAHMLVLRIIQELWQSSGGVFNVDEVLQQMVFGLEEELELRSQQAAGGNSWAQGGGGVYTGGQYTGGDYGAVNGAYGGGGGGGAWQQQQRPAAEQLRSDVDGARLGSYMPGSAAYPGTATEGAKGARGWEGLAGRPREYDALSPMPFPGVRSEPAYLDGDVQASYAAAGEGRQDAMVGGATAAANTASGDGDTTADATAEHESVSVGGLTWSGGGPDAPRLPRQQRRFLGRVRRAMMESIQVIGKT